MEELRLIGPDDERVRKIMNYEEQIMFNEEFDYYLVVDNNPIVKYTLILQKYNGRALGVFGAEIQYVNLMLNSNDEALKSKYVGKGYVKKGLKMLIELANNYKIPYVHLDINPDNIASIKVAEGCGLIKEGTSYHWYHKDVKALMEKSLGDNIDKTSIMAKLFNEEEISQKHI